MKVFCYGAQMSCSSESIITRKIYEYIRTESDIFVSEYNYGDFEIQKYLADLKYRNVTIISMRDSDEYEEWPRVNIGEWPYRMIYIRQHEFSLDPLIQCLMAEKCDEGFFAWDGTDIDVFVGMLAFLGYCKKCSVYNVKRGDITEIKELEDLQEYILTDRNEMNKIDKDLFNGDVVDIDVLFKYEKIFDEMLNFILKNNGEKLCKNDLKRMICKADASIKKKKKIVELFSEKEDICCELIRKVSEWKCNNGNKDELRQIIMNTYEHSFTHANNDFDIAVSWIEGMDGSNDDIVMYLWECVEYKGTYKYIPAGMYADIDEALYYLKTMTSNGGKIEVWERKREDDAIVYFVHRITFYTDNTELKGFQFMRECHINDHDPFEPASFIRVNDNYICEDTVVE